MNHSLTFWKSLCMIKLWGSIPSISVCLAERAACDQVQLIFGQESAPYLMSWPKRLKTSHVLGLFWKWRFLGSLESGHWTFQCFFSFVYLVCLCALGRISYHIFSLFCGFTAISLADCCAYYIASIYVIHALVWSGFFLAELNKHWAILLLA